MKYSVLAFYACDFYVELLSMHGDVYVEIIFFYAC